MDVTIGIGTVKGAWFATGDGDGTWSLAGPYLKGWEVTTFGRSPSGAALLATGSSWYGAALHRSDDLDSWEQVVDGPAYAEGSDKKMEAIWTLERSGDTLFAGVATAGLFRSDDDAVTWQPVDTFNQHETSPYWQPGFGGLAAHRIVVDPTDPGRMWLGASAVGVFRTDDGGDSWVLRNDGVPRAADDDEHPEIGFCVHSLVGDPERPGVIWRQDHLGVFRTTDGAETWERIQEGIPGRGFGFPVDRDPGSGRLFLVPLEADEFRSPVDGRFAVYFSDDDGATWTAAGSSERAGFDGVLRDAMAVDGVGGIYVGSTAGRVSWSHDRGDSWSELETTFPRILSVAVM